MKTICIKTNNEEILEYLNRNLKKLEEIVISVNEFKNYKNIIIHYIGKNIEDFLINTSTIIADCIVIFFENNILEKVIEDNYFYFEEYEKEIVLKVCYKIIELQEEQLGYKKEVLKALIYEYLLDNKIMNLEGFILFRIKEYMEILDYIIDISVTNYIMSLKY